MNHDDRPGDHVYDAMRWPVPLSVAARTWTFSSPTPQPMTRRQTYRHWRDDGMTRRDSFFFACLSEESRPLDYEHPGPTFTVERTDR